MEPNEALVGPALLTVQEIALRLGVKISWVYTHADEIGVFRLGKYLRFDWTFVQQRLMDQSLASTQQIAHNSVSEQELMKPTKEVRNSC